MLEKLERLKLEFQNQLSARISKIDSLLKHSAGDDPQSKADCVELHRELHKLAGAAQMYGLVDIGESAREFEHKVAEVMGEHDHMDVDFYNSLKAASGELRSKIERLGVEGA